MDLGKLAGRLLADLLADLRPLNLPERTIIDRRIIAGKPCCVFLVVRIEGDVRIFGFGCL